MPRATIRTGVPGGVCRSAFSTSARPIWSTRSWSPSAIPPSSPSATSAWSSRRRDGGELLAQVRGDLGELDRLDLDPQGPGVEPREVEQVGGELREPLHLLGHRLEELAPGRLVELLVAKELEKAAKGEDRRPQLVGGVRDELAAGIVDAGELQAHPVEGAGELADLVSTVILDRLVEVAGGDALGRLLEAPQPAREDGRGGETGEESDGERGQTRPEQARPDEPTSFSVARSGAESSRTSPFRSATAASA